MRPLIWLKNTLRNRLKSGLLGSVLQQMQGNAPLKSVKIVCATRLSEKDFWRDSALGRSLKIWRNDPNITTEIHFGNKEGLPKIYNASLLAHATSDVVLFIHDDVWLDDPEWLPKTLLALKHFDIVGIAGNTRISPHQPAWLFNKMENEKFVWDSDYLSGAVRHGRLSKGELTVFGPTPAACELLDGVFLAVRSLNIRNSKILFDEQFDFHFYDLDFCRNARRAGLKLGTWPISLTHQSGGAFGSPNWKAGHYLYMKKWNS